MTSPDSTEPLSGIHFNFARTVHDTAPTFYVNSHNNHGYVTFGPIELTIPTAADAYAISDMFLRMGRDMEERQQPAAALPPGHGPNHIDKAGHATLAAGHCPICGGELAADGSHISRTSGAHIPAEPQQVTHA